MSKRSLEEMGVDYPFPNSPDLSPAGDPKPEGDTLLNPASGRSDDKSDVQYPFNWDDAREGHESASEREDRVALSNLTKAERDAVGASVRLGNNDFTLDYYRDANIDPAFPSIGLRDSKGKVSGRADHLRTMGAREIYRLEDTVSGDYSFASIPRQKDAGDVKYFRSMADVSANLMDGD